MAKNFIFASVAAIMATVGLSSCVVKSEVMIDKNKAGTSGVGMPFTAQVVGVQWLNPLHRQDYPTEWQLLWTMGKVRPNKKDDMVELYPAIFSNVRSVAGIASSNDGKITFSDFHIKYARQIITKFHGIYFSNPTYFYNAHDVKNKKAGMNWRVSMLSTLCLQNGLIPFLQAMTCASKLQVLFQLEIRTSPTPGPSPRRPRCA